MVYRWRCPHCAFTGWSPDRTHVSRTIKSHLLDHHGSHLSRRSFQFAWECPHCDERELRHDKTMAIKRFQDHLFLHAENSLVSNGHVADDLERRGSILILCSSTSGEAANACAHFLSIADTAIFVTATPQERLALFDDGGILWPSSTVVVTSAPESIREGELDIPDETTVDVVPIEEGVDPGALGQTLSRTLTDSAWGERRISVCFDIIPQILDQLELQTVFRFLHLLNGHLTEADAIGHYYVDPREQQEASINILESVFDLTISAEGQVFTSQSAGGHGV